MNQEEDELLETEKKLATTDTAPGMGLDFLRAMEGRRRGKLQKADLEVFAEDELIRKELKELVRVLTVVNSWDLYVF